jgi:hemerythrin
VSFEAIDAPFQGWKILRSSKSTGLDLDQGPKTKNMFFIALHNKKIPRFIRRLAAVNAIDRQASSNFVLLASRESPRMTDASRRPRKAMIRPVPLGHSVIDGDHFELSNCWSQVASATPLQFPFFLARFRKLMRDHFEREADIMANYNSTLCECHEREHRDLLELCDHAVRVNRHSFREAQDLLRAELPRRIREHIICMDQLLVLFINTNGSIGGAQSDYLVS